MVLNDALFGVHLQLSHYNNISLFSSFRVTEKASTKSIGKQLREISPRRNSNQIALQFGTSLVVAPHFFATESYYLLVQQI